MGTIHFNLRKDQPNKDGLFPVQGVYQISGQRKYFKTQKYLFEKSWDQDGQLAVYLDKKKAKKLLPEINYELLPTARQVEEINGDLAAIVKRIRAIEDQYERDKVLYSVAMVTNSLKAGSATTKKEVKSNALFEFMDRYLEDNKATREPGSLSVYRALKNHLQEYQQVRRVKVTFESIDYAFFVDFQNFLLSLKKPNGEGKLNNTTIGKQLSTIKTFLNYARKHGHVVSDRYRDFKIKKEKMEVIALTNEEFEKLYNMDLSGNKRLDQVRDVFCFACTTGLRYSDLLQLRREHIKKDEITLTIKKTKENHTIPLNPYSLAILAKYKGQHKPLPVISNQKMNQYLKGWDQETGQAEKHHAGLCELAGITEQVEIVRFRGSKRVVKVVPKYMLIGVHTGRKTFATLSLEKGMSAEETMAITGHSDYKSFSRYVKITEQRKKVVMRNAWGEIKVPKLKAI